MKPARAFTLIEVIVALVIAGIIIAGTTSAVAAINRLITDTNRRTQLWGEAKQVEEYLIAQSQGAGGGVVRPHQSIFVEDAQTSGTGPMSCRSGSAAPAGIPACVASGLSSDRLTVLVPVATTPTQAVPAPAAASFGGTLTLDPLCNIGGANIALYTNQQALLIDDSGNTVSVFLETPNGASCTIDVKRGQADGLLPLQASAKPTFATLGGATLVVVTAKTFFVNSLASHTLFQWSDTDGGFDVDDDELFTVDDNVLDLQAALGFDGLPQDGNVEDLGTNADEWLFNASGDARFPGEASTPFSVVLPNELRMVEIAITLGVSSQVRGNNTANPLNRSANLNVAGQYLMTTTSKGYLRNLAVFSQ